MISPGIANIVRKNVIKNPKAGIKIKVGNATKSNMREVNGSKAKAAKKFPV